MERQEFIDRITAIGSCEDESERRELLASLRDDATADYDRLATLTTNNESLTSDNEKLRDANMKLFLRLGNQKEEGNNDNNNNNDDKSLSYENLFDEKGELK